MMSNTAKHLCEILAFILIANASANSVGAHDLSVIEPNFRCCVRTSSFDSVTSAKSVGSGKQVRAQNSVHDLSVIVPNFRFSARFSVRTSSTLVNQVRAQNAMVFTPDCCIFPDCCGMTCFSDSAASAEEVKSRINNSFDELHHANEAGECVPHVCLACDEFLKPHEMKTADVNQLRRCRSMLCPSTFNRASRHGAVASHHTCAGDSGEADGEDDFSWMDDMLLSPRGCYMKARDARSSEGFAICGSCKCGIDRTQMPKCAIANDYAFGSPPSCLLALTEVELAHLTPVKTCGCCFTHTGGRKKQLKGSLSHYKVKMESITRTIAQFDVVGLNEDIVVILHGKFTPEQRRKARQKNKVRTRELSTALEWLLLHNEEWRTSTVTLEAARQQLSNPLLIDQSTEIDADENNGASNIESTETHEVFFPDGAASTLTGGQEDLQQFQELVQAAKTNGFDIEMRNEFLKEAACDFKDDNLVNACSLQFPHGRGGLDEVRLKGDGSLASSIDAQEHIQHLSRVSQPYFQEELFSLILHDMCAKQEMVRTAGFKVRSNASAATLANELTQDEVDAAVSNRANRSNQQQASTGSQLLDAVDAVARAVPHSSEAAKSAKCEAEAHQHRFGMPSFFLTVAPDDDNSFLVQVLLGVIIDDDEDTETLSDEDLAARAKERTSLRVKFPGVCACYFELVLDIVIREVIGWDLIRQCPTEMPGLFGVPEALVASIEEQGRSTLHTHMQVWMRKFNEWREKLHSGVRQERRESKRKIVEAVDSVSSTSLFSAKRCRYDRGSCGAFPHPCTVDDELIRRAPVVVDDQTLRNLRHRVGQMSNGRMFAHCPHCTTSWTNEEFVESCLLNAIDVPGLTECPDRARRLKAMAVSYQKKEGEEGDSVVVDAGCDHHIHTRSCFNCKEKIVLIQKNGMSTRKRKRSERSSDECRCREPHVKRQKTAVQSASEDPVRWCSWDGSYTERRIKEMCLQRHECDAFQNVCCPAVSHSKLTCNSNISALMPGPVGQHAFKHNLKDTQTDDLQACARVSEATRKALIAARRHLSDRSESVRRLLSASFAHQKSNVLHGTMASCLVRNKRRFTFSHSTVWCPLRDIEKILNGGSVCTTVTWHKETPFHQAAALHCLCRPLELESVTAHDFFSQHEVVKVTAQNRESLLQFENGDFCHPSFRQRSNRFLQGVQKREREHLVKVFQCDFPDTAEFGGSILDANTPLSDATETHAKLALMLFCSFRSLEDLQIAGSHTLKFRDAVLTGVIDEEARAFLQNIEDARSNCFRMSKLEDDLQRVTERFEPADVAQDNADNENDGEENAAGLEGLELDAMLDLFDEGTNAESTNLPNNAIPHNFKVDTLRQKGVLKCGYELLAEMKTGPESPTTVYEQQHQQQQRPSNSTQSNSDNATNSGDAIGFQKAPDQREIGRLLLTRTSRRSRDFFNINKCADAVEVPEANGSVESITGWAETAKLDAGQKRAFEVVAGSFVLTFHSGAPSHTLHGDRSASLAFSREKRKLELLVDKERRGSDQLTCLLHGPGGCGKTTVIDLLMEHAREHCSYIDGHSFTPRTIVVTAMSGVAATLLFGETTHSALHLNERSRLQAEEIEPWEDTRLLIIDEISFARAKDFAKIHQNLCQLKQQMHLRHGGLNIIFSGDFRQLTPPGKGDNKAVYDEHCPEFKDWVNCFLELSGMHRFSDDVEWGLLLLRFRNGEVTIDDIKLINGCVVTEDSSLPADVKHATYFNRDRDAINAALFEKRCQHMCGKTGSTKDSIMIFSDDMKARNSYKTHQPFKNCRAFWEGCGEDDIKTSRMAGRMDPVLKLHQKCRAMLPFNEDVRNGQANGTQAEVDKVMLKPGVVPETVMLGGTTPVAAVKASQVEHIVLRHSNERVRPQTFCVEPRNYTFTAKMLKPKSLRTKQAPRESLAMKAQQLPLLINNATAGHKLQGSGVDSLFVHNWSKVTNWIYVMLSRVKTRAGLFCRKELSNDLRQFAVPRGLQSMLQSFQQHRPTHWSEQQCEELFG